MPTMRWAARASKLRVSSKATLSGDQYSHISFDMAEPHNPAISLTVAAADRVRVIAERLNAAPVLRLSVEGGGCSGFTYKFGLADVVEPDDHRHDNGGATLVVDPVSLDLLRGSAVDYVESLGGASFQVTNPNAVAGCGCGSSFAI